MPGLLREALSIKKAGQAGDNSKLVIGDKIQHDRAPGGRFGRGSGLVRKMPSLHVKSWWWRGGWWGRAGKGAPAAQN